MLRNLVVGCACVALGAGVWVTVAGADTLKLKDGSTLTGRVIDQGTSYWVKDADGTHTVAKSDVVSLSKDAGPAGVTGATGTTPEKATSVSVPAGSTLLSVKAKADRCDAPIAAVALWQSFLDAKPSAADATAAKQQLAFWQQLVDGQAEKVNGKWLWGDERKKLLKQVAQLMHEGDVAMKTNQMLVGIEKYEAAVKLYPNNFMAQFDLGLINLVQGSLNGQNNAKLDAGVKALETAVKLDPHSAAALSDLAIGYNLRGRYQLSVETAFAAAKMLDSREIVQNLVSSISYAPPGMRQTAKLKPIMEQTILLASKYGISERTQWAWVRPSERTEAADDEGSDGAQAKGPAGIMGNGTGSFISSDGYVLTNRHVAKEGDYLMVRMADGTTKVAERIVIDDEQDMAIIKIKTAKPVPFVRLASYDHPPVGEDVAVFGFPLLGMVGRLNSSVKMTRGIVTAWDADGVGECDVTVDAQINPGNSGGPMVDHFGNLLAITTAKTGAGNVAGEASISSYGLGQSTGRLRKFVAKHADKLAALHLTPGNQDTVLTNESLATRMTPVTVCVFCCRGNVPTSAAGE